MTDSLLPQKQSNQSIEIRSLLPNTLDHFISTLDASPRTKDTYRKALRVFEFWLKDKSYPALKREQIIEYKQYLQEKTFFSKESGVKTLSPLTINTYLTALKRFFVYLEAEKIYPNVAKDIKSLKRPRGFLKEVLTQEEGKRLLESIQGEQMNNLRDRALIGLALHTGLRTLEIARALIGDIGRQAGETILRVWGKGRSTLDEVVILTNPAYQPILDYLAVRCQTKLNDPLFASHSNRNRTKPLTIRSIRRIIEARLKAAGLKSARISAHSLRHTAATVALMNGADLLSVKEMLRHSSLNQTLIYTHNLNRLSKGAEKYIDYGASKTAKVS